ncbi:MAG TPA: MFS transporter [Pseudonocardiaceae bacterium]|jgi:MFS family permease|nr:MFS transporter [Pseudonocardiaceae bacterium]
MAPPWFRVALALFGVGWGANQFSSLLVVYRDHDHLPATVVALLFGAYAVGLVPALLIAASYSDRLGRRTVMRPVLVLAAVASVVLLLAGDHVWGVTVGRLLAGVASGAAFGPGTAWVKESSPPGTGARRAVVALSAGFGGGPLVAGALAQWLPLPTVLPYLAHIVLMAVIIPLVWGAPETVPAVVPSRRGELRATLRSPEFRYRVAPAAPLVFGAATASFAVLPAMVRLHGLGAVVGGAVAGLTLGTGVVVQPLARRLNRSSHYVGIGLAATGFVLGAVTIHWSVSALLVPTAIVLGACYGMLLVAGLSTVERLAAPADLASVTAVFYCLTYVGFATPYVVTAVEVHVSPALVFLIAAVAAALTVPLAALAQYRLT